MKDTMAVQRLHHDETDRELGFPTHVYAYTSGVIGGAVGGVAMAVPAFAYGWLSGHGIWYPVNLVAATVLRGLQGASPQELATFNPLAFVVGLILHLIVASLVGLVFAILLPT